MPQLEVQKVSDADDRHLPIFAESVGGGNLTVARCVPTASATLSRVLLSTILTCMLPAAALGAEADGAKLYQNHCSACHGMRAEGDGPIAMLMTVTVPNLRELAKHNDGVFPTDRVTAYVDGRGPAQAHGGRQMPVWGDVFSAATKADEPVVAANVKVLVQFIEELQQR